LQIPNSSFLFWTAKRPKKSHYTCFWENGSYNEATAEEGDFSLINRTNGQANSAASAEVIQRMISAINNTTSNNTITKAE